MTRSVGKGQGEKDTCKGKKAQVELEKGKGKKAQVELEKGKGKKAQVELEKGKGKQKGKEVDVIMNGTDEVDKDWKTVEPRGGPWQLRPKDWDDQVLSFEEAKATIASGNEVFGAAVLVANEEEQNVFLNMLRGRERVFGVTFVMLGKTETSQSIPGCCKDRLVFREGQMVSTASAGQTAPVLKGAVGSPVQIAKTDQVALYVKLHEGYADPALWKEARKSPQRTFHTWLAKRSLHASDSWSWRCEKVNGKEQLFGIVKVARAMALPCIGHSGEGFFIDPSKDFRLPGYMVEWVERQDKESLEDYVSRARKMHCDYGLTAGNQQVGLRTKRNPGDEVARVWLAERAPLAWDQDQVIKALESKFSRVQLLRVIKKKQGASYTAPAGVGGAAAGRQHLMPATSS